MATTPISDRPRRLCRHRSDVARWRNYVALTKPRIIELLLVTTVPVMFLAEGGVPVLWLVLATLVGGTLSAGAANTFNSCLRPRHRPADAPHAASARWSPARSRRATPGLRRRPHRGVDGLVRAVVNVLSARCRVAAIALYAVGYTMLLKRRTSQNIVWGGVAGCMPTLIGWSAVTGTVQWPAVILFLVIFFWTPPHYWPLSMAFSDDYSTAGVPMLPVEQGPVVVGRQIVLTRG